MLIVCLTAFVHFFASVLTPYYKEDVLYSQEDIQKKTDEGVSILFYLQKNYSGIVYLDLKIEQVLIYAGRN